MQVVIDYTSMGGYKGHDLVIVNRTRTLK